MSATREYPCGQISAPDMPGWQDACWEQAPQRFLADTVSGGTPFLNTEVRLFRDDRQEALFVRFLGEDDEVLATYRLHNECLYRQDVFELFIGQAENPREYLEIEVSPYDLSFLASVKNDGNGIQLDLDRGIPGFKTRTWLLREDLKTTSVWRIPYTAFEEPPAAGKRFYFNAYRIDHHSTRGRSLQALSVTGKPDFHVPLAFIPLVFTP
ncbi:MAG: carbohydrate-binding family 9-like protein [Eubacteriales bacterium]|nr:carbohydrate-binding family 9-like protein [Eubacteriales bacterium]